ncbi:type II secretion system protein GspJ [Sphingomonas panacisoli]|uniref:Type II secretion system protein J n=1 Tax=Sphingomonas panacisoli TaxID=1813879 RepID=A0A5B8LJI3_9SPHN|nr:type II secretion system minor pseudopilin GspJ [Sphingomonas panacisoli]QDZ07742.1 type II secretion system protein GspJ [Sphingomonas panacisoli]
MKRQGFTLVEMMIALLIFSLLAAAGVSLLSFGVRAQVVAGKKLDDVAALYRLDGVLVADLAQALPRTVRDESGASRPAFEGSNGASLLRVVRGGWDNVDGAARSNLQKVEYVLSENGTIDRIAYPMLDGAAPLPAATMLTNVSTASLRYRLAGAWADRWQASPDAPLPDAVELTITRTDGTVFRELFLVGTGNNMPKRVANAG